MLLSVASMDGNLRIYESSNFLDFSKWTLKGKSRITDEVMVSETLGINSISWNKSYQELPMIAIGLMNKKDKLSEDQIVKLYAE